MSRATRTLAVVIGVAHEFARPRHRSDFVLVAD